MMERLDLPCAPLELARRAAGLPGLCLLFSGMSAYGLGRYSILAAYPTKTFSYRNGALELAGDGHVDRREVPLFDALAEQLKELEGEVDSGLPFCGGPIGYLSYDAGRYLEPSASAFGNTADGWDARFAFFDGAIVFDHQEGSVFASGLHAKASDELRRLIDAVSKEGVQEAEQFGINGDLVSNFTRAEYLEAVSRIREYIRDGEVYQVNLSQRYGAACAGSPLELFRSLAKRSPAPYSAYLDFGDEQIVSSSPERLLRVKDGWAETRPIKGTRPAGATPAEAEANARDLGASEKDRSELLMIVDLERNDLGRVCRPGSVRVDGLFSLERYATVIHQTADVIGKLEDGRSALDCLQALFPGGSISGAPKIRAMQLIEKLERGRRGVYTGAIGYLDANGGCDFNIAIRTIRVANGEVTFQVGGGIVWDSDPESEYEETLLKAEAMMKAIGGPNV